MEGIHLRLLFVLTDLIAPLITGWYIYRRHLISQKNIDLAIKCNVICITTILSLLSFWVLPLSLSLLCIPFFGFFFVLFPGAIGYYFLSRHIRDLLNRGAYTASAMLTNIGTLGGVCTFILYNEQGFAITQMIATFQNMLLCLVVFPMAQYCALKHSAGLKRSCRTHNLREMFFSVNQMSILGMLAGLFLSYHQIPRPEVLGTLFQWLVHLGAWTALLPVGCLIDLKKARSYLPYVHGLNFLHFAVLPAVTYLISSLFITDKILLHTILVLSFGPTAINAVVTSKLYKLNVNIATSSFLSSTVIYLAVIFPTLFFLLK